jgi:glycosyltransferase involved in cell wall biosynthesis
LGTNKNKILYVINVDWYFSLHWLDRAKAALAGGADVHVGMFFQNEKVKIELLSIGFTCHDIPFERKNLNPVDEWRSFVRVRRLFKDLQPDVVHCITWKPVIYGGVIAKLTNTPVVLSLAGLGMLFSSHKFGYKMLRRPLAFLLAIATNRRCALLTFENNHDFKRLGGMVSIASENVRIIPGAGVDTSKFLPADNHNKKLVVLFAARLLKSKGLGLLVRAIEGIASDGFSVELHVAGIRDEDSRDAIKDQRLKSWFMSDNIVWHGRVRNMADLVSKADIVCLPTSYGEGIPRILIEASSCEKPIVTTDVAGCNEFVVEGNNGLLVPVNNVVALSEAIKSLIKSEPLRKELGRNGRIKVERYYSNDKVISKTLALYEELLSVDMRSVH